MKIKISLETGNEAMLCGIDVSMALQDASVDIGAAVDKGRPDTGKILDENGNTVGKWEVKE